MIGGISLVFDMMRSIVAGLQVGMGRDVPNSSGHLTFSVIQLFSRVGLFRTWYNTHGYVREELAKI